ncbi:MAG: hypothetical protein OIF48_16620 [Silicimonas sp.]|nr:hypothetical protein [Silicimonas sp.]
MNLKKTATAMVLGFAMATSSAHAGGMAEPIMEAEVIEEQAKDSGGFLVPLLLLAILIAVASGGGSSAPAPAPGGGGFS